MSGTPGPAPAVGPGSPLLVFGTRGPGLLGGRAIHRHRSPGRRHPTGPGSGGRTGGRGCCRPDRRDGHGR
ncbi:MAG: hypothetical protein DLM54_11775 [Acidimicrobiales bacterium]|nr:MAG: hypothetical protein DLM54_11775 [Acidimicrobiales bacterium]